MCRLSCEGCRLMFIGTERRSASFTIFLKSFEAFVTKWMHHFHFLNRNDRNESLIYTFKTNFLNNGQNITTFVKISLLIGGKEMVWWNDSLCDEMTIFVTKWLGCVPRCDTIIQISPFIKLFRESKFEVHFFLKVFWSNIFIFYSTTFLNCR